MSSAYWPAGAEATFDDIWDYSRECEMEEEREEERFQEWASELANELYDAVDSLIDRKNLVNSFAFTIALNKQEDDGDCEDFFKLFDLTYAHAMCYCYVYGGGIFEKGVRELYKDYGVRIYK